MFDAFMPNADLAFGAARHRALVERGPRARRAGLPPLRAPRARSSSPAGCSSACRDWLDGDVPRPTRRTGCWRRGCCTRGSGPTRPIVRVHDAGDRRRAPARRHAGAARRRLGARRRRSPGSSRTRAARCGPAPTSSASSSRAAGARRRAARGRRARRRPSGRSSAGVTPTQLYGRLLAGAPVPERATARPRPLPLRPRRDADPLALAERPDWQGDERLGADGDRPRHARPRRRLAGGQRGRARAAAGRGDDRLSASRWPWTRRARPTARGSSGSSSRSCPPAASRATPPASSTSATAPGRRSCEERYADRIQARLARHIPNLESATLARVVLVAGRHGGGERQLRRRRHLRRLVRARPEPALAAAAGGARPPDRRRRPLPHRREHAPGPGARRRLRLPRRARS